MASAQPPRAPTRILALLDPVLPVARHLLDGVAAHARERGLAWSIEVAWGRPRPASAAPDAAIVAIGHRRRLPRILRALPLVAAAPLAADVPEVVIDQAAVGGAAAGHLRQLGRARYVCCLGAAPPGDPLRRRGDGFVRALLDAGVPRSAIAVTSDPDEVAAAARSAPLAVFAVTDRTARRVIEAALRAGLRVPQDLAVAGAGDDPSATTPGPVPLTSVALPFAAVGRSVAAALERLLRGEPAPRRTLIPPASVVVRNSTAAEIADPVVAEIMRRIAADPGTCDLARLLRSLPCSRRALERRCAAALGHGPAQALRRARMGLARRLLAASDDPIATVARRCGFASLGAFSVAFTRAVGTAPSAWRAHARGS